MIQLEISPSGERSFKMPINGINSQLLIEWLSENHVGIRDVWKLDDSENCRVFLAVNSDRLYNKCLFYINNNQ